ncbi:MAG: restriction endonuclease [Syntrophales bacterium]|jgi:restriction system protein
MAKKMISDQQENKVVEEIVEVTELEQLARNQIIKLLITRFKGNGLAQLVESILIAKGYSTYCSPEGPDGGVDIVAGQGMLGMGSRLCVKVKPQDAPESLKSIDEIQDLMKKYGVKDGILVSLNGFENSIYRKVDQGFFNVRLWAINELLDELFSEYDHLDENLKALLRLKKIWIIDSAISNCA